VNPVFKNGELKVGNGRMVYIRVGEPGEIRHEADPGHDGVRWVMGVPKPSRGIKGLFNPLPRDLAQIQLWEGHYWISNMSDAEIRVTKNLAIPFEIPVVQDVTPTQLEPGDRITVGNFSFVFKP